MGMNAHTTRVVGLDVSLTNTGVATLACTPRDEWTQHVYTVPTTSTGTEPAALLDRMNRIAATVAETCGQAHLVVIEGGAYSSKTAHQHTLAGCWWLVFRRITRFDMPVIVVPPTTLKKYVTGKGNAGKLDVALGVARMWPDVQLRSSDVCDALGLASMGAHLAGLPVPYKVTKDHANALAGLTLRK
ncbi:hypothetical protein OU415_02450 [Saccharopolyspora sp. WRP15-2]|uniref:Uncharacterized protein n=1 Tax=Saccharopolyspora oryzae TaxID=2997343 RepID=A0ABT4URC9_9PSEU|nr:hypothetical protein [Saccharopolyspora oryzae]MDA3624278.1 hypothetical protein [Saccharopolyspora oryzae]